MVWDLFNVNTEILTAELNWSFEYMKDPAPRQSSESHWFETTSDN